LFYIFITIYSIIGPVIKLADLV